MSPFDFNDNGETDGEDFFLVNGPLGNHGQNDNKKNGGNKNNPLGCGTVIVLIFVMFLLSKCLF